MKAARLHEYGKPLVLEDIPVPDIQPDEILVNVKAGGMCRSDVQLVDGYFRKYADIPTPITLGHEITGIAHKIGGPHWLSLRRAYVGDPCCSSRLNDQDRERDPRQAGHRRISHGRPP